MSPTIYSELWKAFFLVDSSTVFPLLVRGACARVGVAYSEGAMHFCATDKEILRHLTMSEGSDLDDVLEGFARDPEAAQMMDTLIVAAAQKYKNTIMGGQ